MHQQCLWVCHQYKNADMLQLHLCHTQIYDRCSRLRHHIHRVLNRSVIFTLSLHLSFSFDALTVDFGFRVDMCTLISNEFVVRCHMIKLYLCLCEQICPLVIAGNHAITVHGHWWRAFMTFITQWVTINGPLGMLPACATSQQPWTQQLLLI